MHRRDALREAPARRRVVIGERVERHREETIAGDVVVPAARPV
jgi:hypothetical protein